MRDGGHEARVSVADVARKGIYGVGALEGLRGEITIADGEVWITEGDVPRPITHHDADANATVLFVAEVHEWRAMRVETRVEPQDVDTYVQTQAQLAGLDVARPFPFLIDGALAPLRLHVVAGECPIRARALSRAMRTLAFELAVDSIEGRIVGIYAPDSSGVVCHGGSNLHAHAVLEQDGGLTGHVEVFGIAAGAVLVLPVR